MFAIKDEQIKRLEKKIETAEKRMNRNFLRLNDSLQTVTDVITRLEKENRELKKDRDFLIEKHREIMRSVETESRLINDLKEKFVSPARNELREDIELMKQVVTEGFRHTKKDELFDMVMKNGKVKASEAARKLNVHEMQIETWARDLEKAGLVETNSNCTELRKKS